MLGCGLLRLLSDVYVCSSLSLWLCIFLDMSGCLFLVVLCFLEYNEFFLISCMSQSHHKAFVGVKVHLPVMFPFS